MIYLTKYALTKGIITIPNKPSEDDNFGTISIEDDLLYFTFYGTPSSFRKPDWHLTLAEALERVEIMRLAKVRSLQGQLKRMQRFSSVNCNVRHWGETE